MTTVDLDTLIGRLHALVPAMVGVARRLVEVNSYTAHVAGVDAVGDILEQVFALPGLTVRRQSGGATYGDNLFWKTAQSERSRPWLLIGHHDVVFPQGSFERWDERDGRVNAPGILDMKGSFALIWGVLKTLADAQLLDRLSLELVSVSDEELGSLGSRPALEAAAVRAQGALVFEAGRPGDAIITSRRGVGGLRVTATGRAAHAGNAHREGANAIRALARFVEQAEQLTNYALGTTVNVGTIQGGSSPNTVPAHAEAVLDLRFDSVAEAEALLARLHACAAQVGIAGVTLRVEGGIKRPPMQRSEASLALYRAYAEAQREAGLGDGEQPLVGGGSDANTVAALGIPVIDGLGLRGEGMHTHDEYVLLDSFAPKAEALLRFLHRQLV